MDLGDIDLYELDSSSQSNSPEDYDALDADDFIQVFDNIEDFEKEIGIDGEVSSINEQSIENGLPTTPELRHSFRQPCTASTSDWQSCDQTQQDKATYNDPAQEKDRRRQQRLEILVEKRRRDFQDQRQRDNANVPVIIDRLGKQKQHLDGHKRSKKQRNRRSKNRKSKQNARKSLDIGSAMMEAIKAADDYGIGCSSKTQHLPKPIPVTLQEEPLDDLDPADPDPWTEEKRHYLLLGRIKRAEHLQDIRAAQGKEYPSAPIYHSTGLPRHDSDPLLSRNGQGLSITGAALAAVASNSRTHPRTVQRHNIPSSTSALYVKSEKLLVSNLPATITESALQALKPDDLEVVSLNTSTHTASLSFLTIESAVMFRRKYNRFFLGGKHIAVHFDQS